jgi:hypothetical protein
MGVDRASPWRRRTPVQHHPRPRRDTVPDSDSTMWIVCRLARCPALSVAVHDDHIRLADSLRATTGLAAIQSCAGAPGLPSFWATAKPRRVLYCGQVARLRAPSRPMDGSQRSQSAA